MSKRTYRRLAVVAGAALTVGSMAPAMAVTVGAGGSGAAAVNVSDVTLPSTDSLIPGTYLAGLQGFALGTVFGPQGAVSVATSTAGGLQHDVSEIVANLSNTASGGAVAAGAGANVSNGGAAVQVSGVATGATNLVGVVPNPVTAVAGVHGTLTPVVGLGLGTATGALALAGQVPGMVTGQAGGLLSTGLGLVDTVSVSTSALAAVAASL